MATSIAKTDKILCIVESPNKRATISSIFKSLGYTNVNVMASVGHITQIKDSKTTYWNTGITFDEDVKVGYVVSPDKKDVVENLKKAVAKADIVILATDLDREGEAISWHLKQQLKISSKKYYRITFHEITKTAIAEALEKAHKIDDNLVDAAISRSVVDKCLGYRLSPLARACISAKSVGRCQSVGLEIVVDRENEIRTFVPETYYDLYLHFIKNSQEFKAKYASFDGKMIKRFTSLEQCEKIKADCAKRDYSIDSVENKEIKEYPKAPFITSTFQQEANRVYGMSIDTAMSCAQKLFEGLSIGGEHVGLITYIRTDDATMAPEFVDVLSAYVSKVYDKKYLGTVKKAPKSDTAQAGHECLRVIDPEMTPAKLKTYITDVNLLKIYRLIWNRTVASIMTPAIIGDTQYNIKNGRHMFVMHSRELLFDGYRALYSDPEDATAVDDIVKETFVAGEILKETTLQEEKKQTTPPKRYTQGSLVKELEKQGVGRPSTFATIVKTILTTDRGYCEMKSNEIVPTEKGIALVDFLRKNFDNIINVNYTSDLEKNLDLISNGKKEKKEFLFDFIESLEKTVHDAGLSRSAGFTSGSVVVCPECGAPMKLRKGPYGSFWGCTKYPTCKGIRKATSKEEKK